MQEYINRLISPIIKKRLSTNPAVALLGPRQCGKSTLAKQIIRNYPGSIYLDLENPSDLNKLKNPNLFFSSNAKNLICLDEIQRIPDLFSELRSILDKNNRNGQLLILGSASRELIRQSSETLAGRISYCELTPFLFNETNGQTDKYWLKGGFPRSYLAKNNETSFQWRSDFITTFLERDISQLGFLIPSKSIRNLWTMCAHNHGQLLNASKIGESLGVTHHTVKRYIDILEQTFLVRSLPPYLKNTGKRLTKSHKIYIRDTGILHALLEIETFNDLLGHPILGSSWEGMVIENIISAATGFRPYFYRTSTGSEIDLVLEKGNRIFAIECKTSTAPDLTAGFWNAINDLKPEKTWIAAPADSAYDLKKNITVTPLNNLIHEIKKITSK